MVLTSGTLTVDGKVASTTLETSGAATVGGDLTLSNTAAVAITHSGTTSLSISSGGYVAVESVQFAGANIGISDTDLMVLTSGTLTVDGKVASTTLETSGAATVGGDLTLSNTAAVAITHSGTDYRLCRYRAAGTWRCSRCSLPAPTSASTGTRT